MSRLAPLAGVAGLLAASCVTTTEPLGPRSAEEHDEQARLATTARDHAGHLRAASELRRKEASACAPTSEPHEAHRPLLHPGEVAAVEAEYQNLTHWRRALRGAALLVTGGALADPEAARMLVTCHLAQAASHGWAGPGAEACPFCVRGTAAVVAAASNGVRIEVRGDDEESAGDVLRRARALLAKGAPHG